MDGNARARQDTRDTVKVRNPYSPWPLDQQNERRLLNEYQ